MNLNTILEKLQISELNEMQQACVDQYASHNIVLHAPTGSGKTLAFLLPLMQALDVEDNRPQALIIVPTRELAFQVVQTLRDMAAGFRVQSIYGGKSGSLDKRDLERNPQIIVGTPGRLSDFIERELIDVSKIKHLILDEYDKILEYGFENELMQICSDLRFADRKILSSATVDLEIPAYVHMGSYEVLHFENLHEGSIQEFYLKEGKDRKQDLVRFLKDNASATGVVFCTFKDQIKEVADALSENGVVFETFHGDMEQRDREEALIKLHLGGVNILLASDLAARGIDVPALDFIIHFSLPQDIKAMTHRNGRTGRMNATGKVFYFQKDLSKLEREDLELSDEKSAEKAELNHILLFLGGKQQKVSKKDIVGCLVKDLKIGGDQIGKIIVEDRRSFVAIAPKTKPMELPKDVRIKKNKIRLKWV